MTSAGAVQRVSRLVRSSRRPVSYSYIPRKDSEAWSFTLTKHGRDYGQPKGVVTYDADWTPFYIWRDGRKWRIGAKAGQHEDTMNRLLMDVGTPVGFATLFEAAEWLFESLMSHDEAKAAR